MSELPRPLSQLPAEQDRPSWRCRLFGHRWTRCHTAVKSMPYGLLVWAYIDDLCLRCYRREWRMP